MAHDIRARASNVSVSAQKMRLIIDMVRGKSAAEALTILKFEPSKAAHPISKLVQSALANAEKNAGVSRELLYVHEITADEARTRKWRRFGARGRFKPVLRRAAHITLVLREREGAAAAEPAKAK
ncbi:MAG: 50S ribosomal protein L22 [Anaerolineales bacterium]|jgi:large subunit ribosomal protein L22